MAKSRFLEYRCPSCGRGVGLANRPPAPPGCMKCGKQMKLVSELEQTHLDLKEEMRHASVGRHGQRSLAT